MRKYVKKYKNVPQNWYLKQKVLFFPKDNDEGKNREIVYQKLFRKILQTSNTCAYRLYKVNYSCTITDQDLIILLLLEYAFI